MPYTYKAILFLKLTSSSKYFPFCFLFFLSFIMFHKFQVKKTSSVFRERKNYTFENEKWPRRLTHAENFRKSFTCHFCNKAFPLTCLIFVSVYCIIRHQMDIYEAGYHLIFKMLCCDDLLILHT